MKVILGLLSTVAIWVLTLVPLWVFLAARSFINPEGFWQNFVTFGFGFYVLGGL